MCLWEPKDEPTDQLPQAESKAWDKIGYFNRLVGMHSATEKLLNRLSTECKKLEAERDKVYFEWAKLNEAVNHAEQHAEQHADTTTQQSQFDVSEFLTAVRQHDEAATELTKSCSFDGNSTLRQRNKLRKSVIDLFVLVTGNKPTDEQIDKMILE
jgi:hypothetical protein